MLNSQREQNLKAHDVAILLHTRDAEKMCSPINGKTEYGYSKIALLLGRFIDFSEKLYVLL